MNYLTRFKFFLWRFGLFKVAMIGYVKPRIIQLTDAEIVIYLPLIRRNRNHLNSMYFGALAVGADLAGGLHGFYHADKANCAVSLAFKSFHAQFLRRPESAVYFVCTEGEEIKGMIEQSKKSGERVNRPIHIHAYTDYPAQCSEVANFILELSLKIK